MKISMKVKRLLQIGVSLLIGLLLAANISVNSVAAADAGKIVGTGAPDSCTETALDQVLAGGGNITFNCGITPVVIAITTEKAIAQNTMMDGGGSITISGAGATRVFSLKSGITLELHKITIAYGAANDSAENTVDGNGGGILNDGGTLTLIDSSVTNSRAAHHGGSIFNRTGMLTLVRSTLSGNYSNDLGGAIFNESGTVNLANTTLSSNFAGKSGGGLFNLAGNAMLINVTLFENNAGLGGSGLSNGDKGNLTITNTIIADNPVGDQPYAGNCTGTITDGGKNMQFPDGSCGDGPAIADPALDVLADNGGFAQTHALKAGSPAIDAGDNAICNADPITKQDERTTIRPIGPACDIGAYEYNPKNPGKITLTTTIVGSVSGCNCQNPGTIKPCPKGTVFNPRLQQCFPIIHVSRNPCPDGDFQVGNICLPELQLGPGTTVTPCPSGQVYSDPARMCIPTPDCGKLTPYNPELGTCAPVVIKKGFILPTTINDPQTTADA